MRRLALIAVLAAGCADLSAIEDDDCTTSLVVTPSGDPIVGTEVRVTASIITDFGGISNIDWRVRFGQQDVPFTGQGAMEIAFTPLETGTYSVEMVPCASGVSCPSRYADINVVESHGYDEIRLHIAPPGTDVPPIDRVFQLPPGTPTYALGALVLDPGRMTNGTVGRQAYLRFIPDGEPEAVVEAYTDANGAYSARVQSGPHHILVTPTDPAYPPQMLADTSLSTNESYTLQAGVAVTGTVLRPNGAPLADAKIQLFQNDTTGITIPSTVGTSAANGTFTLRAFTSSGTNARVVVTAPVASGLPRLETSSQGFNFTNPIAVNYGTSLVTRNISGTTVTRGAALANAKVTIVGTIPFSTAGTIVAGASAVANGFVRVPVTANASGVLPSALVPAGDLYAVVEPSPGDAAVVGFDTTSSVPSTISAPAMVAFSTEVILDSVAHTMIDGARLELVPSGALGMAGVGPTVLYANAQGILTGSVASGAIYKTYLADPTRRGGPSVGALDVALLPTTPIYMQPALVISGSLKIQAQTNTINGAAVQVLCNQDTAFLCDGVERDRPLGEDASNDQGAFEVAVTQPPVPI